MSKSIPEFKNEEREFWASHDTSEYSDWSKASERKSRFLHGAAFPKLKRTAGFASLRQLQKRMRKKYGELPSSAEDIQRMREERTDELMK